MRRPFTSLCSKVPAPLLALLRQGVSPERLALGVAIGVAVGNVPILGISTLICAAIALVFRLNLAAIQIAQAAMAPTQLLLIVPLARLGEWILNVPRQPVSIKNGPGILLHAGFAWVLVAPVTTFLCYRILIPVFERSAARLK
jgi:uncharacterized protein (DUF2062 family)